MGSNNNTTITFRNMQISICKFRTGDIQMSTANSILFSSVYLYIKIYDYF